LSAWRATIALSQFREDDQTDDILRHHPGKFEPIQAG
jgi:hypothetical protein